MSTPNTHLSHTSVKIEVTGIVPNNSDWAGGGRARFAVTIKEKRNTVLSTTDLTMFLICTSQWTSVSVKCEN